MTDREHITDDEDDKIREAGTGVKCGAGCVALALSRALSEAVQGAETPSGGAEPDLARIQMLCSALRSAGRAGG